MDYFGNYPLALDYALKETKLLEKAKDTVRMATRIASIASLYEEIGDLESGIRYAKKGVSLIRNSFTPVKKGNHKHTWLLILEIKTAGPGSARVSKNSIDFWESRK